MSEAEQLRANLDKIRRLLMTPSADQATSNCSYCPEVLRIIDGNSPETPDGSPRILLEAVPDGEPCAPFSCEYFMLGGWLYQWRENQYSDDICWGIGHDGRLNSPPLHVQPVRLVQVEGQQ